MDITQREVRSIEDLLHGCREAGQYFLSKWNANLERGPSLGEVWFRGHAHSSWKIVPLIWRGSYHQFTETNMAHHFRMQAPMRYLNCPGSEDFAGWLSLMRHYGLPTRLIDWSHSPLVAAYFALEEASAMSDAAIWALSPYGLNDTMLKKAGKKEQNGETPIYALSERPVRELLEPAFEPALQGYNRDWCAAVTAPDVDIRMLVQQSTFTIHGNDTPLEEMPDGDRYLQKFVIPKEVIQVLSRDIALLGTNEAAVFPDLSHLAKDIARREGFVFSPPAHPPLE